MMEFCDPETFQIILATDVEHYDIYTLKELLPLGFGPGNLKEKEDRIKGKGNIQEKKKWNVEIEEKMKNVKWRK